MGGTVYLDRQDAELRLDGKALAVYVQGEREGLIPLAPVDRVVLIGHVSVDKAVLHRLCEEGIAVLLLSGRSQTFRGRPRLERLVRRWLDQFERILWRG